MANQNMASRKTSEKIRWLSVVRVLGLVFVLTYHFFKDYLPAGFLGVDVFFTLSGYLTTSIIIDSIRKKGSHNLLAFYKRRFLRIFPPLFTSVLFTLPFALLLHPDFTAGISKQLAAVFGFVTNYFEIQTGGSYEAMMLPHLYIHTWTLALEMHFYIVWGLITTGVILVLKKVFGAFGDILEYAGKMVISLVSLVIIVISYLAMRSLFNADPMNPNPAYFSSVSRAFPFMLGALTGAAFGSNLSDNMKKRLRLRKAATTIAICIIVLAIILLFSLSRALNFNDPATYLYGFPVASILAAIMIICARVLHETLPDGSREPRILSVASDLSYCIYLFHWPLYTVFSNVIEDNRISVAVTLVLSILFSAFVFYLIEPMLRVVGKGKTSARAEALRPFKTAVIVIILIALIPGCMTIARAPEITTLEAELLTGYLYQDSDRIIELSQKAQVVISTSGETDSSGSQEKPPDAQPLDNHSGNNDHNTSPGPFPTPSNTPGTASGAEATPTSLPPETPSVTPTPSDNTIPSTTPTTTPSSTPELTAGPPGDDVISGGVTIIGDSVCLGARRTLIDTIENCYVDADGSRQMSEGYNIIMKLQNEGNLREYVVVALGNNGEFDQAREMINRLIADIDPSHRLIFVTPYDGRASATWWSSQTREYMYTLPDKHAFVTIADWYSVILPQASLLGSDKVHIGGNSTTIGLYVDCIIDAMNTASQKPAKP